MSEQTSGVMEKVELREKKDGGKYVKFTCHGSRYSFWDMDWYKLHPELFQVGASVRIIYYENEYIDQYGKQRTSRNATAVTKGEDFKNGNQVLKEQKEKPKETNQFRTAEQIIRCEALKCATEVCGSIDETYAATTKAVIELAAQFEAYITTGKVQEEKT